MILDEATSNLDDGSDATIQELLRAEFATQTVLTIAHRLHTVIDYDTILVMGSGKLLEQGSPHDLLNERDGALTGMAQALGVAGANALLKKTLQAAVFVSRVEKQLAADLPLSDPADPVEAK